MQSTQNDDAPAAAEAPAPASASASASAPEAVAALAGEATEASAEAPSNADTVQADSATDSSAALAGAASVPMDEDATVVVKTEDEQQQQPQLPPPTDESDGSDVKPSAQQQQPIAPPSVTDAAAAAAAAAEIAPASQVKAEDAEAVVDSLTAQLEARIARDPRDGQAWLALLHEARSKADVEEIRKRYDAFFLAFPNAAREWEDYAELELSLAHTTFPLVEAIFTRCLRTTPSTDLWRFYLSYTRRVNPLPPPGPAAPDGSESEREKARKVIEGAYEFALKFIGQSRDAGEVWREYIALLKEREASNSWQEGQKMDDIRRAYQRAVAVPLSNIEIIWREYDQYENSLNRITAKKFLAERSPAYMTARSALKEMQSMTSNLHRPPLPRVPVWAQSAAALLQGPRANTALAARERGYAEAWKQYLQWEESNPLELEDLQTLHLRVLMAYRKATMHMRFYAEIWYMASRYAHAAGRDDESVSWLKMGMEACPGSFLLHFAFIEQAEARGETSDCAAVFAQLLQWVHDQIDVLRAALDAKLADIDAEGTQALAEAAARRRDAGEADENVGGEERAEVRKQDEERAVRKASEEAAMRPIIEELKEAASLVWIKQMHFVRRTEGRRPSRAIFGRARKSAYCTWQVYEANALMEFHCSKDVGVATKVFELALKTFGSDEAFVVRYLDFLISINDDNNARALFERTVGTFEPERARPLWDRWCDYEYNFGDRASMQRLEERLREIYPDEPPIKRFIARNTYMDLDVVSARDLGFQRSLGGSSAADRAVAATRGANEAPVASALGGMKRDLDGEGDEPPRQGSGTVKRARFSDVASGEPIVSRRSASPNSTRVPIPLRPQPGGAAATAAPAVQPRPQPPPAVAPLPKQPQYFQLPEAILYFMDILPSLASFGPARLQVDDVMDGLRHSSLPMPSAPTRAGFGQQQGPPQAGWNAQQGGPSTGRPLPPGRRY